MNQYPAAVLSDGEAFSIDQLMPGNQNAKLGSRLQMLEQKSVYIQRVPVAVDASGGLAFTAEVSGELVDAWVVCTAANASGTLGIRRSTTNLTTLMVCAVIDVLTRTALVLQSGKAIVQGEALNVKANGANDRGIVYMAILRS